ncbi:unnamed protein product, partial [Oncorhynchus mykiss]
CHNFCRSRCLSLFGRCSAVDVTGLLAIIDPCFIFYWLCLVFLHTWFQSHSHPEPIVAHIFVFVTFPEFSRRSQHKALVDKGAAGIFKVLAHNLGTPIVPVDVPFPVHALDSRPLGSGLIRETTSPLSMVTQGGHTGNISISLIDSPAYPVVLGLPWLAYHKPTVSWPQRALTGWSRLCSGRCLGVSVLHCAHSPRICRFGSRLL